MAEYIYRIYTINGASYPGVEVREFKLGNGAVIPAIIVGESGRGRSMGVLPVSGAKPGDRIMAASVAQSRSGRPKLIARPIEQAGDDKIIAVLETKTGYRGSNSHTGDRKPEARKKDGCSIGDFLAWPGEDLVTGVIAQGAAGRMGSGSQKVSLVPAGAIFRTAYSGRLYGGPSAHYHRFCDGRLESLTWDDRLLLDEW